MNYRDLTENVEKLGEGLVKPYVAFCVEAKHSRDEEDFEAICALVYDAYIKDDFTFSPMDNYVRAVDELLEEGSKPLADITPRDVLDYMAEWEDSWRL